MFRNRLLIYAGLFALVFGLGILSYSRVRKPVNEKYRETRMLMGTIIHIDTCAQDQSIEGMRSAYADAWARLEDISWRMNVMDERSEVAQLNRSHSTPIHLEYDTYFVLEKAIEYSNETRGSFDITVWPLIALWKQAEKNNRDPTQSEIDEIRSSVGIEKLQLLPGSRARRLHEKASIDLGGIAKGYAVDEAARILRDHGIINYFIDAGGDVFAGGHNCQGQLWRIGIRDPRDTSKIIDVVLVSDRAVATSGNYEQYFLVNGKKWSHIINPLSGYPQEGAVSASVIAPTAIAADAYATALTVLGGEAGTSFIDSKTNDFASLIFVSNGGGQLQKYNSSYYPEYQKP